MTVLFVCTGNTCRSPMAAALMRRALDRRGRADIIIESAGLSAYGQQACPYAIQAIAELDEKYAPSLGKHISMGVTAEQLKHSDIIAVMSKSHAAAVIERGAHPDKVNILSSNDGGGIADPYGGDIDTYRSTRDQLEKAVEALAATIC